MQREKNVLQSEETIAFSFTHHFFARGKKKLDFESLQGLDFFEEGVESSFFCLSLSLSFHHAFPDLSGGRR